MKRIIQMVLGMLVLVAVGTVVFTASSTGSSLPAAREALPTVKASAEFACAAPVTAAVKPGSQLHATVTLGQYTVTLRGGVVSDTPADSELVLKSPTIITGFSGRPGQSADLFTTEPAQIPPLDMFSGSWNDMTTNWKGAAICLAKFSDKAAIGVGVLVTTAPNRCNQCTNMIDLYNAYVGFIQPLAVEDVGHFPAGITSTSAGVEVVGDDPAFFGAFSDDAGSADPLRVYRVTASGFADVTRSQTVLLVADARVLWTDYRQAVVIPMPSGFKPDVRGILSAWAADECDLGHCGSALAIVAKRGVAEIPQDPSAAVFLHSLKQMLVREGYASSSQVAT